MPPAHALAIVIVPAIVTNIWQTFGGPYLRDIIRRLWPLMVGTVAGIWLNAGMLTGPYARYGTIVLGVLLVIYAIIGLSKFSFNVAPPNEKWIGGIVGLITGVVSAATGVQVIPRCRSCRRSAWRRTNWCRRSGCSSRSRPLALAFNLTSARLADGVDRAAGRRGDGVRRSPACSSARRCARGCSRKPFRRWFLIAMILLGLYLAGSALLNGLIR